MARGWGAVSAAVLCLGALGLLCAHYGGKENVVELQEETPKALPVAFAEEAEKTRLETAIRLQAAKLERDQTAKKNFDQIYAEKSAEAEAEKKRAEGLLQQGRTAASQAVERRAEYRVAKSKADADQHEVALDKKLASLMAYRAQSLREHAKHRAEELASLENKHKDLAEHREDLIEQAKRQGRQAEAVIATADNLLKSAREMSQKGAERAASANGEYTAVSKSERLAAAQKEAHQAMESDMERLAAAKLSHKGLTGVEGVDELSRAQEKITALDRKLSDLSDRR